MRVGPYDVTLEAPITLARNVIDAQRVRFKGVPRLPGADAKQIAEAVLQTNAHRVLHAGMGHFKYMWPADFGKALRGAYTTLPRKYLDGLITDMLEESARLKIVPSCFSERGGGVHGFNMPYARADNLPWLIHSVFERLRQSKAKLSKMDKHTLQNLLDTWESHHMRGDMIALQVTGDWMDTVLRPSSTYNNLCALYMFQIAESLGLKSATDPAKLEWLLLKDRFRRNHFTEYAHTEREGVDAAVLALYLGLFDKKLRNKLATRLHKSKFVLPYPIHSAGSSYPKALLSPVARITSEYHNTIWLHLGLMYLNGLKRLGRDVAEQQTRIEKLIIQHGNVLETLSLEGKPFKTPLLATEYGLTMAAGQYLELKNV